MKATMLLKKDHSMVSALFKEFRQAKGPTQREQTFERIRAELETHAAVEEEVFYPEIRKIPECSDLVKEALQEHKMVKQLLAELARMDVTDDDYVDRVEALQENVDHHVEEEESEIFPLVKKHLSDDRLDDLGKRIEAFKAAATGKVRKQLAPA
jgi:hemerythrin superfamily protein